MNTETAMAIHEQKMLAGPQTIAAMKEYANNMITAGMLPKKYTKPEQVVVAMLYGRELGLSAMRAAKEVNVIEGNPGISVALMNERIRQNIPGGKIKVLQSDTKVCRISWQRSKDDEVVETSYTWDEAVVAGLTTKFNWRAYPKDMLFNRCFSRMVRVHCPDGVNGFVYTPEELEASPVVVAPIQTGAPAAERAGAAVVEAELVKVVENDAVNEDAVLDLVAKFTDITDQQELEKAHREFAEFWKEKSPATAADGYSAYKNRLKRLRDAQAKTKEAQ